jgi:hypothetical protein
MKMYLILGELEVDGKNQGLQIACFDRDLRYINEMIFDLEDDTGEVAKSGRKWSNLMVLKVKGLDTNGCGRFVDDKQI